MDAEAQKLAAARAAAALVEAGMTVGLGTGSTVAHLLPALASRSLAIQCVATSPRTEEAAVAVGLTVVPFGTISRFDITIDGADQIAPDGWLVKGGGAAHTREKIVASAADRFVVIADASKVVAAIRPPIPLELLGYGLSATVRHVASLGGSVVLRNVPASPDNGVIADYHGEVGDPAELASWLGSVPGVVEHGLFPPQLVHDVIVASDGGIEHRRLHD
jgi:ribose 5-phosphate isomerase A